MLKPRGAHNGSLPEMGSTDSIATSGSPSPTCHATRDPRSVGALPDGHAHRSYAPRQIRPPSALEISARGIRRMGDGRPVLSALGRVHTRATSARTGLRERREPSYRSRRTTNPTVLIIDALSAPSATSRRSVNPAPTPHPPTAAHTPSIHSFKHLPQPPDMYQGSLRRRQPQNLPSRRHESARELRDSHLYRRQLEAVRHGRQRQPVVSPL